MLAERWLAIGFATLSAVLLYSALNGERGVKHVFRLEADLADANDRNFRLVQGISTLRDQVRRIRTDDGALELVARRRLSLVRRDETLYRILPPRTATPSR
jgi:cell division protein FtsB